VNVRTRAALAAGALLLGLAHPASAGVSSDARTFGGQCGFDAVSQVSLTGPDEWVGTVYGYAVAYSPTPAHNPVTLAEMRCELFVDGVLATSVDARTAGPLGVLEPTPIQYTARDDQWVELCTEIGLVDAAGQPESYLDCGPGDQNWPPQWFFDLLDGVFGLVGSVDPLACPVLGSLSPGIPGVVDITPEGDTTLVGAGPFWDCPPYGNLYGP
jgi:hypothetical protein